MNFSKLNIDGNEYNVKDKEVRNDLKNKFVCIKDFGAVGDGETDDTLAFQNAIDFLKNKSSHENYSNDNTLILTGGIYKITKTIELSPFVSIKTDGYVTIHSYVENTLFNLEPDEEPEEARKGLNRQNYFVKELINGKSGFRVINKLEERGNTIAFSLGTKEVESGKYYTLARTVFKHITINGFNIGMKFIPHDFYFNIFDSIYMEQNNYSIVVGEEGVTGYKNSGENISFNKCIFAGCNVVVLYTTPEQAIDFNFNECSFDFNNCVFYSPNNDESSSPARRISIDNSHIEGISYQVKDLSTPHGILYGTFRGYEITISNSRILQTNNYNLFYSKDITTYTLNIISTIITCYNTSVDFSEPNHPFMANENVKNINIFGNWCAIGTGINNRLSSYNNCLLRPDVRNLQTGDEITLNKTSSDDYTIINDFKQEYYNKVSDICSISDDTPLENGKSLELTVDTSNLWDSNSSSGSASIRFSTDFINGACGDIIGVSALLKNVLGSLLTCDIYCYDLNDKQLADLKVTAPITQSSEWKLVSMARFVKLVPGTVKFKVKFQIQQNTNDNAVNGDKFYIGGLFVEKI